MKHTESFVGVPATLNALYHKDYKSQYLETYIAIRSLISLSPERDNFCFCFPSIETIGKKYRLTAEAVRVSVAWLKSNSYLYTHPRGKHSNTYTIVIQRERFLLDRQNGGLDRAIEVNEDWMEDQKGNARIKNEPPRSWPSRSEDPRT